MPVNSESRIPTWSYENPIRDGWESIENSSLIRDRGSNWRFRVLGSGLKRYRPTLCLWWSILNFDLRTRYNDDNFLSKKYLMKVIFYATDTPHPLPLTNITVYCIQHNHPSLFVRPFDRSSVFVWRCWPNQSTRRWMGKVNNETSNVTQIPRNTYPQSYSWHF